MPFGVPELVILAPVVGLVLFWIILRHRAKRLGYASAGDHLRAAPRSDAEKRDAADLALKGVVCCALGLLVPLLVLVGLVPLLYGGPKLVYASLGLLSLTTRTRQRGKCLGRGPCPRRSW